MTEMDALEMGERDAATALRRLEGARGPQDVERVAMNFLIHRLKGRAPEVAKAVAAAAARIERSGTMSLRLARRVRAAIQVMIRRMAPEDVRAMLLWSVGAPGDSGGDGFITTLLLSFRDDRTDDAVSELQNECRRAVAMIQRGDQELFAQARAMPPHRWGLVEGCLARATAMFREGDGESSRDQLIHSRRLARRLIRLGDAESQR